MLDVSPLHRRGMFIRDFSGWAIVVKCDIPGRVEIYSEICIPGIMLVLFGTVRTGVS